MTPLRARWRRLGRLIAAEDGAVTTDFVLVFPAFMMVFLGSFEAGMLMTRSVMLERAVDMSVRDLRIGLYENPTHDQIKADICSRMVIMPDCMGALLLELRPVSTTTWNVFDGPATCVNRDEEVQPVTAWTGGSSNEMMLVRACAVFDPYFPTTSWGLQLPLDASGGYQLVAMSAFVNEPR